MTTTSELTKQLLDYHGCQYEENVVHQLNEYAMKLMKTILNGASDLADIQKRSNITTEDIKQSFEYLQNPSISNDNLTQIAIEKNNQQLCEPIRDINNNYGIKLPASESNKLIKPNFQVITQPDFQQLLAQYIEVERPGKQQQQQQQQQQYQTVQPKLGRKKMNIQLDDE